MKTCIISCGSKKIWDMDPEIGPVEAKNAYVGGLFLKTKKYAEIHYGEYFILSAKYGIIPSNFIIPETYNISFKNKKSNTITIKEIENQLIKYNITEAEILAGNEYIKILEKASPELKMITPLKNMRIGFQLKYLKEHI